METSANPETGGGAANEKPLRLPFPPPPHVGVTLSQTGAAGLHRLTHLTGQTPGEVAAVLLMEYLSPGSAQKTLCVAAEKLRALHGERRRTLPPSARARKHPAGGPPPGGQLPILRSVRIPLSAGLNDQLYQWAVEAGLAREQMAKILIEKTNLRAMAAEIRGAWRPASDTTA